MEEERNPTVEEVYSSPRLEELQQIPRNHLMIEKELYQPAASEKFNEISRDLTLSKITVEDTRDIRLITYELQILGVIIDALQDTGHTTGELKMMNKVKDNFESDLATLVNAKRAEGGFTFEGLTKARYELSQKYKTPKQPKSGMSRFFPGA